MREKKFLLAVPEARVLEWIARRLPFWLKPDHLTALGVLAALGIAAAYVLSNGNEAWLWAASALLVVHWLGDSLDGTLARFRRSERPRYGYYLDHLVDAFATAAIGIGLGPTEARLGLIGLNTALFLGMPSLDVLGIGLAGAMLLALGARAARNLKRLAELEPSA